MGRFRFSGKVWYNLFCQLKSDLKTTKLAMVQIVIFLNLTLHSDVNGFGIYPNGLQVWEKKQVMITST